MAIEGAQGSGPYIVQLVDDQARDVATAVEKGAALAPAQFRDVSTTRQSLSYPGGARVVMLQYRLLPGATPVTNQLLRVCMNAGSDLDAAGKLTTAGAHLLLFQGDDLTLVASEHDPIYRIDFLAEQAVGAEKTVLQVLAGV